MKKKYSLRLKVLTILIIFILFVLGLIYILQTSFLDDFYRVSKANSLKDISHDISKHLDSSDLKETLENYYLSSDVCVRVVTNDNSHLGLNNACELNNLDDRTIVSIYQEVKNNNDEKLFKEYKYRLSSKELRDIYIYGQVVNYQYSEALILVSSFITPLGSTVKTIKSQYLGVIVIVLIATIILAFVLSKIILKPINNINSEINNLPNGQYNKDKVIVNSKELKLLNDNLAKANSEIIKAEKAKKDLLANISHDLRTPLTMIQGYGEMIRDLPNEDNRENAQVIIDESKRLSSLVNDLIDYSKFQEGSILLSKKKVSINSFLKKIYKQYNKYYKSQKIKFKLELSQDKKILIDEKRITQVIYNFLNNSVSYNSKDKKEVILGTERLSDRIRVYVKDNGDGISSKDLPLVFDRYYRIDNEHTRMKEGSGIGLSLSREILKAHGFNYGVESKENEYSKFYFEI